MKPTPEMCSDETINRLTEGLPEIPAIEPITTQVRKLDLSAWPMAQAKVESEKRYVKALIENMPADELERRLSCAGLECFSDAAGNMCIRTVESGNRHREDARSFRQERADETRRHLLAVEKEVTERKLTEIDPDWKRIGPWNVAAEYYHEELRRLDRRPSRVIASSPFSPPEFAKPDRDESDDGEVTFDDGFPGEAHE